MNEDVGVFILKWFRLVCQVATPTPIRSEIANAFVKLSEHGGFLSWGRNDWTGLGAIPHDSPITFQLQRSDLVVETSSPTVHFSSVGASSL